MLRPITTVGDLRRLLAHASDDLEIEVAATPDITFFTQRILNCHHVDGNKIVLALSSDTISEEERSLVFIDDQGRTVRPFYEARHN